MSILVRFFLLLAACYAVEYMTPGEAVGKCTSGIHFHG